MRAEEGIAESWGSGSPRLCENIFDPEGRVPEVYNQAHNHQERGFGTHSSCRVAPELYVGGTDGTFRVSRGCTGKRKPSVRRRVQLLG